MGSSELASETRWSTLLRTANTAWHEKALWVFMAVVLGHWAEHIAQAGQIWVLDMPRTESLGGLGLVFPALVTSEAMHFTFALLMIGGLVALRSGFQGTSRRWWDASMLLQGWHFIEHAALLAQVVVGVNLFGSPVPSSFLQPFVPRAELHLLYNLAVFVPMVVAMWLHTRPQDAHSAACTCGLAPPAKTPAVTAAG